ncbi:hypothetical protein AGMMS49959_07210 [Planctomycetales bacterium]|nr:hypothetical protein AGMMS49959_07210 [Planctomycetales bacterium]
MRGAHPFRNCQLLIVNCSYAAAARALARQDAKAARIAAASKPVPSARMVLEPSRSLYANLEKTVNLSVLDAGYAGKVLRRS